jgi:pre-peptidase
VTVTGRIAEPRETDAYSVSLKKGDILHFRLEARAAGSPLDPVLIVADSTGKIIQRVDDVQNSRDAELNFTAPSDGQYLIKVADLHRRGGWRFVYRLTIARPQPDFKASVAADAFVLTPGKPLEIPLTIERTGGFAEEIEFTAADLPAGVTAMPVKSLSQGDTAKAVKLILTATEGPRSGGLTISGKSTGSLQLARKAHAPLVGAAHTGNLWLTVVK